MIWKKQTKEEQRQYYRNNLNRMLYNAAKSRAAVKNIPFNLELSDIEIPDVCPYLKTPFVVNTRYAASLDRIDPRLGYIKGNVEVISRKANTMKNDATTEELLEFAYTILERN